MPTFLSVGHDAIISPARKREQEKAIIARHGQGLRNVRNGMDYFHFICVCIRSHTELS